MCICFWITFWSTWYFLMLMRLHQHLPYSALNKTEDSWGWSPNFANVNGIKHLQDIFHKLSQNISQKTLFESTNRFVIHIKMNSMEYLWETKIYCIFNSCFLPLVFISNEKITFKGQVLCWITAEFSYL